MKDILGADDPTTLIALEPMAETRENQSECRGAYDLYHQAHVGLQKTLGSADPRVGAVEANVSRMTRIMNDSANPRGFDGNPVNEMDLKTVVGNDPVSLKIAREAGK